MLSLNSFLAEAIRRFIALRRLSGTDYHSQALLLAAFDRFVAAHAHGEEPQLSRQLLEAYQQSLSALAPRTRANRMCVVRQLCRYLAARDPCLFVPEPVRAIPSPRAHVPYLYSHEEVQALLAGAATLPPPRLTAAPHHRHHAGTALQHGPAYWRGVGLEPGRFLPRRTAALYRRGQVPQGPLAASGALGLPAASELSAAPLRVHATGAAGPLVRESPRPPAPSLQHQPGLPPPAGALQYRPEPTRQCSPSGFSSHLRHYPPIGLDREGCDVNARLPVLATYLGHVDITSTQCYLHPTAELLAQVQQRFHTHYLNHVKAQGGAQ
jgi:hypothetical protein